MLVRKALFLLAPAVSIVLSAPALGGGKIAIKVGRIITQAGPDIVPTPRPDLPSDGQNSAAVPR